MPSLWRFFIKKMVLNNRIGITITETTYMIIVPKTLHQVLTFLVIWSEKSFMLCVQKRIYFLIVILFNICLFYLHEVWGIFNVCILLCLLVVTLDKSVVATRFMITIIFLITFTSNIYLFTFYEHNGKIINQF